MNKTAHYSYPKVFSSFLDGRRNSSTQSKKTELSPALAQDVFQKKSPDEAAPAGSVNNIGNNDYICNIYNRVYDTVIKENPIVNELNITKPDLIVEDTLENESLWAAYNFQTNCISVSPNLKGNYYLYVLRDEKGEIIDTPGVTTEENYKKNFDELKKMHSGIEAIKLNDEEKEIYFSSVLAHELRHAIQSHLIASTDGCAKPYKKLFNKNAKVIKKNAQKVIKLKKELLCKGGDPKECNTKEEERILSFIGYPERYKPKKILDKNALLKFSQSPSDNRYWSVREHFLTSAKNKEFNDNIKSPDAYYANPLEIDAHNYQAEYLISHEDEFDKPKLRDEVMYAIKISLILSSQADGVDVMGKYAFAPMIQK